MSNVTLAGIALLFALLLPAPAPAPAPAQAQYGICNDARVPLSVHERLCRHSTAQGVELAHRVRLDLTYRDCGRDVTCWMHPQGMLLEEPLWSLQWCAALLQERLRKPHVRTVSQPRDIQWADPWPRISFTADWDTGRQVRIGFERGSYRCTIDPLRSAVHDYSAAVSVEAIKAPQQ